MKTRGSSARARGARIFGPRDRTRLKLALRGKRLGLQLSEIRSLIDMYDGPGDTDVQLRQYQSVLAQPAPCWSSSGATSTTPCTRSRNRNANAATCWRTSPERAVAVLQTFLLFVLTALAEIIGCYLPYLWLRKAIPPGCCCPPPPGAVRLVADAASRGLGPRLRGLGGVYISMALLWLWLADGVRPVASDWIGAGLCLAGMLVIMFGPRSG